MKGKKGFELNSVAGILLTFAIIVIVASLIGTVLTTMKTTQRGSATATDEITLVNGTAVALTNDELISFTSCVNASDASDTVPASNYTVDMDAGTVTLIDATTWDNTAVNCTYTYTTDTLSSNISTYGLTGTTSFANLLPTVGVVIGIITVLGILFLLWNPNKGSGGI